MKKDDDCQTYLNGNWKLIDLYQAGKSLTDIEVGLLLREVAMRNRVHVHTLTQGHKGPLRGEINGELTNVDVVNEMPYLVIENLDGPYRLEINLIDGVWVKIKEAS
jgi:hypothetical protein